MIGREIILSIILVGIFIIFSYSSCQRYAYAKRLEQLNDKWINKEFIPLDLNGVVKEINKYEEPEFFPNLIVQNEKEILSFSLCLLKDSDFVTFVKQGDRIVKKTNDIKVTFIKTSGETKSFELPFCYFE